jgi:YidC/Oxa1 family membrane protein insertase
MRYVILLLAAVLCWASESAPLPTYDEVVIENPAARAVLSTNRGSLLRFELKTSARIDLPKHLAKLVQPVPEGALPVLRAYQRAGAHNWLADHDAAASGLNSSDRAPWTVSKPSPDVATFSYQREGKLRWTLTYRMDAVRPTVGVELAIANLSGAPVNLAPLIVPINGVHQDYGPGEAYYCATFDHSGGINGALTNHGMPAVGVGADISSSDRGVDYLGLKSRFFAVWWSPQALAAAPAVTVAAQPEAAPAAGPSVPSGPAVAAGPSQAVPAAGAWSAKGWGYTGLDNEHQAYVSVAFSPAEVAAGGTWTRGWSMSASSMTKQDLAMFSEVEQQVKYTDGFYRFFKILANGLTWVLDMLAKVVGHYGIAVILLTILIKAVLYRTTFKQQESMLKMQKIGPELKYLQEQYKNNKQMLAQKQMEMFKKHGVNPLGGCLPILIQLPIFIALFQAFSHSADLRGTSFLWISDLTLPDQVWGTPLAFLGGWVLSFNPLPIIYIGVSAWMSFNQTPPANSDPQQEMMYKMMRWMPVIFGVIFYNMPSGLVLYFTVQAVISTLELKYIKKKLGIV